jgi:hypothetical protein
MLIVLVKQIARIKLVLVLNLTLSLLSIRRNKIF